MVADPGMLIMYLARGVGYEKCGRFGSLAGRDSHGGLSSREIMLVVLVVDSGAW